MPYEMLENQNAPFTARYEIDIFAPSDKVWDWLSRVDLWSNWRQDVTSAYWIDGEGANGTMKWRLKKLLGFTAQIASWRNEREMSWDAVSWGTRLRHELRIDGDFRSTLVTLDIAGHGGLLRFPPTRAVFTHYVNRSNEIWLGALKTKLEFGKEEALKSLWSLDSPFEGNVKLSHDNSQEDR